MILVFLPHYLFSSPLKLEQLLSFCVSSRYRLAVFLSRFPLCPSLLEAFSFPVLRFFCFAHTLSLTHSSCIVSFGGVKDVRILSESFGKRTKGETESAGTGQRAVFQARVGYGGGGGAPGAPGGGADTPPARSRAFAF